MARRADMNGLQISLRNLLRHRMRTAISVGAIAFGVVAMLLAGGFIEWIFWAMRDSTIASRLGHVQIVQQDYLEKGRAAPYDYLLPRRSAILPQLEALPGVLVVSPRVEFSGLVSHGETTVSFLGEGVDPSGEELLSREVNVALGNRLSAARPNGVFMGEGLAANLGVQPGDAVVLLVTPSGGGIHAVEAQVEGFFYTSTKAYDDTALRIPLDLAEQLLRTDGVHRWVILLEETERTDALVEVIRDLLEGQGPYQVVPWHELADFYQKTVELFSRQMLVLWVLIGGIIVLTISNTLIRSMLERTGEIGTLMALGARRTDVLRQFLLEGLLLGIIGGLSGIALGTALAYLISWIGIPMPPPPGMNRGFTGEILLTADLLEQAVVLAVATASLASIYPAWRASRLPIVDALRHNR
jgi:putative ABC transport system permease protein